MQRVLVEGGIAATGASLYFGPVMKGVTGPRKQVAEELHFLGECCETQDQSVRDHFFLWILVLRRGGPGLVLRVAEQSGL